MMRFFLIISLIILLVLMSGLAFAYEREMKNLSSTVAENISKAVMKKIAVVDFQAQVSSAFSTFPSVIIKSWNNLPL
jgi:hypothetical protein